MTRCTMSVAFAMVLLAGLGCGKKDTAAPTTKDINPAEPAIVPTLPTAAVAKTGDPDPAPLKAAAEFVKAVQEGKATSASLTDEFKKVIAPPELEADKAAGYSESGVQAWLSASKSMESAGGLKIDTAAPDYAIASTVVDKPGRVYLRLSKVGPDWLIDHARFNVRNTIGIPFVSGNPAAAAALAMAFFIEAILTENKAEIEALLSKAAKSKFAPPLFDDDKLQGFSRLNLHSALAKLLPPGIGFKSLSQDDAGLKATVTFVQRGPSLVFIFKLVPGPTPGSFLIDDLQQK